MKAVLPMNNVFETVEWMRYQLDTLLGQLFFLTKKTDFLIIFFLHFIFMDFLSM